MTDASSSDRERDDRAAGAGSMGSAAGGGRSGRPVLDRSAIAAVVAAERLRLSDFLDGLTEAEWAVPSLCTAWTVRDVVAHLTTTTRDTVGSVLIAAVRARGSFDRMTADTARQLAASHSPAELVTRLRASAESSRRMPGSGPMDPLMDLVIHGQDIARPLGRPYPVPAEVVVPVLDYVVANRIFGGRKRVAGVQLAATDIAWSSGRGPAVCGPADDLLLAAAGRPSALAALVGPGVSVLSARVER